MLEVGNGGMTYVQYKSHFALWCLFKSPLLIGCDLSQMSEDTLSILGAEEVIAVSQVSLHLNSGFYDLFVCVSDIMN